MGMTAKKKKSATKKSATKKATARERASSVQNEAADPIDAIAGAIADLVVAAMNAERARRGLGPLPHDEPDPPPKKARRKSRPRRRGKNRP